MRRIIQRYQDGGAVEFGTYMPDQLPSDSQSGSQQQGTASSVGPLSANPMVLTGIPEGGYAKQAIADYLAGKTLGGPLSYVAGESNVPDYRALADELGTSVTDRYRPVAAVGDNNTAHEEMMGTNYVGTDLYPGSSLTYDQINELSDLVVPDGSYNPSTDTLTEDQIKYVEDYYTSLDNDVNTNDYANDPRVAQEDLAMGNTGYGSGSGSLVTGSSSDRSMIDDLMDRPMSDVISNQADEYAKSGKVFDADDPSTWVQTNDSSSSASDFLAPGAVFAGGGTDNQGNFGIIGDIGGDLAESLGIVPENYDWGANELDGLEGFGQAGVTQSDTEARKGGVLSGLNLTGPVVPTHEAVIRNAMHPTNQGGSQEREESRTQAALNVSRAAAIARFATPGRSAADAEQAWLNAGAPMNNGGYIGPLVKGYNNGGVSLAKSGIREEEIQERQRMQSRLPQIQQSPLPEIGSRLVSGAINKGIGSAASALAGQQGLVGTLGTALGGTAAGAGTGMMAALGPIGIGLGLGKLFGVFNKGGEVTCSCGKPNCNCSSKMKYSL